MIRALCLLFVLTGPAAFSQTCNSDSPTAFMCQATSVHGVNVTLDVSTAADNNFTSCTCDLKLNGTGFVLEFDDNPNTTNCGSQLDIRFSDLSMQMKCGVPARRHSSKGSYAEVEYTREPGVEDVDSRYCLSFYGEGSELVLTCTGGIQTSSLSPTSTKALTNTSNTDNATASTSLIPGTPPSTSFPQFENVSSSSSDNNTSTAPSVKPSSSADQGNTTVIPPPSTLQSSNFTTNNYTSQSNSTHPSSQTTLPSENTTSSPFSETHFNSTKTTISLTRTSTSLNNSTELPATTPKQIGTQGSNQTVSQLVQTTTEPLSSTSDVNTNTSTAEAVANTTISSLQLNNTTTTPLINITTSLMNTTVSNITLSPVGNITLTSVSNTTLTPFSNSTSEENTTLTSMNNTTSTPFSNITSVENTTLTSMSNTTLTPSSNSTSEENTTLTSMNNTTSTPFSNITSVENTTLTSMSNTTLTPFSNITSTENTTSTSVNFTITTSSYDGINITTDGYLNETTTDLDFNVTTTDQINATTGAVNETVGNITTHTAGNVTTTTTSGFWEPPYQEYGVPERSNNIVVILVPLAGTVVLIFVAVVVYVMCKRSREAARRTNTPDGEKAVDKNDNFRQRSNFLTRNTDILEKDAVKPENPADNFIVLTNQNPTKHSETSDSKDHNSTPHNGLSTLNRNGSLNGSMINTRKDSSHEGKLNGNTMTESGKPKVYEPNEREKDILGNLELTSIVLEQDPEDPNRYFKKSDPGDWYRVIMKGKKPRDSDSLLNTLDSKKGRSKRKQTKSSTSESSSDKNHHRKHRSHHSESRSRDRDKGEISKKSKHRSSSSDSFDKTLSDSDKPKRMSVVQNKPVQSNKSYADSGVKRDAEETVKSAVTVQPKLVVSKPLNKEPAEVVSKAASQPRQVIKHTDDKIKEKEPVQTRTVLSKSSSVTMPAAVQRQGSVDNVVQGDPRLSQSLTRQDSQKDSISSFTSSSSSETVPFQERNTPQRSSQTRNSLFGSGGKFVPKSTDQDGTDETKPKPVKRPEIVPPLNLTGTGDKVGRTDDGFEEFILN